MVRNSIDEAIVLKSIRFSEYHKRLTLLTTKSGIIDVVAYGAFKGKSKLSGITESFVHLRAYLYFEPVKKQFKLSDAEAVATFDGIRHDLKRFYIAALVSEAVMRSFAGGDEHAGLFPLLADGFALLSSATPAEADLLLIQLLYRFLLIIGYPPDWAYCERCGAPLTGARFVTFAGGVGCERCGRSDSAVVSRTAPEYLKRSATVPLGDALRTGIEPTDVAGLKRALIRIVQRVVETPLKSISAAGSMLS